MVYCSHTATSRKVVEKLHAVIPIGIVGGFDFIVLERMVREAMEMCLRVLSSLFFKEI